MTNFLKEPVQRKVFFLVVVFICSLSIVIGANTVMQKTIERKEQMLKNQLALRSLGEAMIGRLQMVELDVHKVSTAQDKRDLIAPRKRIAAAIGEMEAILRILEKGGVFTESLALNLRTRDELKRSISYTTEKKSAYVVEAINIAPKLTDIKLISEIIIKNASSRLLPADSKSRIHNDIQMGIRLKQIDTVLKRSQEDANQIFYDTLVKITALEKQKTATVRWFSRVRYGVAIAVAILGLILFFITAGQISKIIMERRQALDESDALHHRSQLILRASKTAIAIYDRDFNIRYVDPLIKDAHGDFIGKKCFHYLMGRNEPCDDCRLHEALSSGKPCVSLKTLPLEKDRPVQVSSIPYLSHDGESLCAELYVDITEQKQIENLLMESEARLKTILDTVQTGIIIIDPVEHVIADVNSAGSEMIGINRNDIIGRKCHQFVCPNLEGQCPITDLGQAIDHSERVLVRKDGSRLSIIKTVKPVMLNGREHLLESFIDITARKQAEQELKKHRDHLEDLVAERSKHLFATNRKLNLKIIELASTQESLKESEEKYRLMMETITDPVYICSHDFRIEYMNPAMIRKVGHEAIGEICHKAFYGKDEKCAWCPMDEFLQGKNIAYELTDPVSGRQYSINCSLLRHPDATTSRISIFRDITEIKLMEKKRTAVEAKLQQAQKMEAIGSLAGGIAHDFNNILSSILGYTELALDDLDKNAVSTDYLRQVYTAGNRAKDLVKQILTFARQSDKEIKPIRVSAIVKEALKFIRSSIPATIEIRQNIKSGSLAMGDPTQIHQILMNLCTNSAHAMEKDGGVLDVELIDVRLDADFTKAYKDFNPGAYLKISVSDTGSGIPPEVLPAIFEPYFTTKAQGEGTGLGLATVHGIVKQYGGEITVDSEVDKGSVFNVYLPVTQKQTDSRPLQEEAIPTGNERILFIDDEPPIAQMGGQILQKLGYRVTIRTSSVEALALFCAKPDAFDLVITDMTMPNMTGDKLSAELIAVRPDIAVIMCTGYSKLISEPAAADMGIKAFVYKPVARGDMAKTVRRVLDETKGNPSLFRAED